MSQHNGRKQTKGYGGSLLWLFFNRILFRRYTACHRSSPHHAGPLQHRPLSYFATHKQTLKERIQGARGSKSN